MMAGFGAPFSIAQETAQSEGTSPNPNESTNSKVIERLTELGMTQCIDRIDDVLTYLAYEGKSDILVYYDPNRSSDSMVSFMITRGSENQNYLATLDFAQTTTCNASYELVRVWASACKDVLDKEYSSYTNPAQLSAGFELRRASEHLHVAARPLGDDRCLTVQKEVIF